MRVKMTGAFAILAVLLIVPATAWGHGDRHDGGKKVVKVNAGESIQDAIDKAKPGTTIRIAAGTFKESLLIKTDDIELVGAGRKLTKIVPPDNPTPGSGCVEPGTNPPAVNGICAFDVNLDTFEVIHHIDDLEISNLSVTGFSGIGIFLVGNRDAEVRRVIASDDGAYGIFANNSTGTVIARNVTGNTGEAGVYVGDSPNADAVVYKNVAYNSTFGIFIRDAANGVVQENKTFGNCTGVVFLNTDETAGVPPGQPTPPSVDAKNWVGSENSATANNKVCTGEGDEPPFAGNGIVVASAINIRLTDNEAFGNVAPQNSGTPFSGGIVVVGDPAFMPSSGIKVKFNTAIGNVPDLFWDGQGTGNEFVGNDCLTSQPDGLCTDPPDDQNGSGDHGDDDHGDGHGDNHGNHGNGNHGKKHKGKAHKSRRGGKHELKKHDRDD
jgi:parallel beta-helix repeat protein